MGGSESGTITAWNVINGQVMFTLCGHSSAVTTIEVIKPEFIASGSKDTSIILWDLSAQSIYQTLHGHNDKVNCIEYTMNGHLVSGSDDKNIILWEISSGAVLKKVEASSSVNAIKQVETKLAVGLADGNINIYDVSSLEYMFTLSGHSNAVMDLELLENGYLASCSIDGNVFIWNVDGKHSVQNVSPFNGQPTLKIIEMSDLTLVFCGNSKDLVQFKINYDQAFEFVQHLKDFNNYACNDLNEVYKKTIIKATNKDAKLFSPIDSNYFLTLNTLQTNDVINAINKIESKLFKNILNQFYNVKRGFH